MLSLLAPYITAQCSFNDDDDKTRQRLAVFGASVIMEGIAETDRRVPSVRPKARLPEGGSWAHEKAGRSSLYDVINRFHDRTCSDSIVIDQFFRFTAMWNRAHGELVNSDSFRRDCA